MERAKIHVNRIVQYENEAGKTMTQFCDCHLYYSEIEGYSEGVFGPADKPNCVKVFLKSGRAVLVTGELSAFEFKMNEYDKQVRNIFKLTNQN